MGKLVYIYQSKIIHIYVNQSIPNVIVAIITVSLKEEFLQNINEFLCHEVFLFINYFEDLA